MDQSTNLAPKERRVAPFVPWVRQQYSFLMQVPRRRLEQLPRDSFITTCFRSAMADADLIRRSILREVDEFRAQSYEHFRLGIYIHPVSDAEPVYNYNGVWVGFARYDFDILGQPYTPLHVRLARGDRVMLRHIGSTISIFEYLTKLNPQPLEDSSLKTTRGQWDHQFAWWRANRKTFRFLELPVEIRELVYNHTFGTTIEPYPTSKARRLGQKTQAILSRVPSAKTLLLSRQIYKEASAQLFLYTTFFVEHLGVLGALLSNKEQRQRIRRLRLALSHHDYFRLFGGLSGQCGGERVEYHTHRMAEGLQKMRLNSLDLIVSTPSSTTGHGCFEGACQKTMVEWLLEAAWPIVRGQPIKVNGYIKAQQKATFEAASLVDRKRYEAWQGTVTAAGLDTSSWSYHEWLSDEECEEDGGMRLDGVPVQASKTAHVREDDGRAKLMPPTCLCQPQFTLDTWSTED